VGVKSLIRLITQKTAIIGEISAFSSFPGRLIISKQAKVVHTFIDYLGQSRKGWFSSTFKKSTAITN